MKETRFNAQISMALKIEDLLISQNKVDGPWGLALDLSAGKMYWAEGRTSYIRRANLDGSQIEDLFKSAGRPREIALGF